MNVERMKELEIMRNEVNRAHKAKKTLRYLLIVMMLSVASMVFATAQSLAQKPEAQMKSTSGMVYSGVSLPQAAADGVVLTGSTIGSYSPANGSGPNRAKRGADGEEDDTPPSDPQGPNENPIGDAAIPLMLLALAYAIYKVRRRMHA